MLDGLLLLITNAINEELIKSFTIFEFFLNSQAIEGMENGKTS